MKTKRIVISGGPCSGKTALIHYLEKKDYPVKHEISRDITLEAQKQGIEQLFLEEPIRFSQKLLEGRLKQFQEAENCKKTLLFYDRGMPDVTAYMDYLGTTYSEDFTKTCSENRYDTIFVLPPWKEIYHTDNERYESWEQAEKIYHYIMKSYRDYGYDIHQVPVGTVKDRAQHILDTLKDIL